MPIVNQAEMFKLVPPEGGWGYVVALGQVVIFLSLLGAEYGFALIFNDFLIEIGIGTSIVAVLGSCSSAATSIAGLFSDTFAQKFSRRSIGVAAAITYCFGSLFEVFAYSAWPLFVASIIRGVALGIMQPIIFLTFNQYFVERRTLITSATSIVTGFGHVASPLTVQYLMESLGFRGCLGILAGINCLSILGMWVMHPVEWHMKKVPINVEDSNDRMTSISPEEIEDECRSENSHKLKQLTTCSDDEPENLAQAKDGPSKTDSRVDSANSSKDDSRKPRKEHALDSTGSLDTSVVGNRESTPETTAKMKSTNKFLDLDLLKDGHYVILIFGIAVTIYSDHSFASFQPMHLFELNYSKVEVSRIIAVGTAAELVSTCILTAIATFKTLPPKMYYCGALLLMIIVRYVFFYIHGFWGMAIITGAIGFLKTLIYVPLGLLFAEYLPKERFASGYGLFIFLNAMFNLIIGPIIRIVKEYSESYLTVFHVLNILLVMNATVWGFEFIWMHYKQKRWGCFHRKSSRASINY